ncbi:hypothetical protein BOTBODRAFT_30112 [Botryobasidium botryosum FD-172 SS1]|uniref:Aldehyde dehydrogenase domain-containing protein n=1 Tax=Botryobasidium botryosum (strain FD-172 SS1) TaxID=930990 RepID=A0A067N0K3_BOTB1|nr:hypothetical protein BOTBODRAFT_30112 [Botryobasidium botryosum FD-172 SS1]
MLANSARRLISGQCVRIRSEYGPFIGEKMSKGSGPMLSIINPSTGDQIVDVSSASPADVASAISQATSAFISGKWSRTSVQHRATVLSRLARELEKRVPELAIVESMQTGRTIREMKAQLARLPEWIDYFAALTRTQQGFVAPTQGTLLNYVTRVPLGVVAQITPFNHPLLIAVKKIAPALAAGNSVIVKPSEIAPISVLELAQMAIDAGVPPSILTVLPGGVETAQALVSSPLIRKVDVTAGTKAGRAIGSIVGSNLASYTAELGGKAPILVFSDADIPSAVNGVAFATFVASGQTCVSGTRLIVHENIYDEFVTRLVEKAQGITRRIGDPLNPVSAMGTIISLTHLERISAMVSQRSKKSKVLLGGHRLTSASSLDGFDMSKGSFYAPTIIEGVDIEDELWQEEVFGPVLVVTRFKDEESGIALANACKYGLGAGIWTRDVARAHRVAEKIDAGLVWVNTHHRNDPSSPWGGMKESGIGRENGVEALESYSQSKSVIVNTASAEVSRETEDWFAEDGIEKRYG